MGVTVRLISGVACPEEEFPFVRFRGSTQPSEQVFDDGENRGDGSWKRKREERGRELYHAHVDMK